jgi:type I restriction enzyme S subunit
VINDLKPYPKMKDSGVSWLGEVPEHWATLPLKRWVSMNRSVLPESTPLSYEFRYLDIGSVGTGVLTARPQPLRFATAPSRARRVVRNGDTLVSTVRTYLKAVYFVDRDSEDLVCSTGFAVLTPTARTVPRFVSYLCQSSAFTDRVTADSVGIAYPAIAETKLGSFPVAVPPFAEQAAIVRFLDHADRRIRRYIRAKQKLIKLLEEQKQAIIHRAVTRGLDPNVRLKPSGVEWLGDVPEHWEVRRLKSLVKRIDQGVSPQAENYLAEGPSWGVLKAGCVNRGVFREEQHKRLPPSFSIDPNLAIAVGDVLVSRASGSPNLVGSAGRVHTLRYQLILSDKTFRPLFRETVDPDFMVLAMNSLYYREQVRQAISGAEGLANNLPLSSLRSFRFAIPKDLAEQRVVVQQVLAIASALQDTVLRTEREIALLREYRIRLIADVVTGKLDVREAAARLPEETEEPEPLDEAGVESDAEESDADNGDALAEEAEA